MIPQANITAWRSQAPWRTDAQVEQDLILSRALAEIYSDQALSNKLAFRGGTALHKLFITPAGRYSEDIDLVQIEEGPIGPIFEKLREMLSPWLGAPRYNKKEGRATLVYRFESETPPVTKMRLKVEINTREHFHVLGLQKKKFSIDNPWVKNEVEINTFYLEELLATKLRALYQRKKGRDLFDLSCVFELFPDLDVQKLIHCFKKYMSFTDDRVSRKEFEACLSAKLQDPVFINDIKPLLATHHNEVYDITLEGEKISQLILSQL